MASLPVLRLELCQVGGEGMPRVVLRRSGFSGGQRVECWVFFGLWLLCGSGCLFIVQEFAFNLVRCAVSQC